MPAVLTLLRIKNLALVEELEWELGHGFVAVTGETGAGKSIIIGALQLLLGERADKSLIRSGAESCAVEAVFEGEMIEAINDRLAEAGVEPCIGELILKRTFSTAGANRQFVNGSPTTLAVLKSLGDELVDLHGPHDHQSLLSGERQLAMLDAFAHADAQFAEFQQRYRRFQELNRDYTVLSTAEDAREHELDLLRHQVAEITAANLDPAEEEQIQARYKLATNSKRLIELATAVSARLSEADDSVLSQLAETQRLFRELEKIDPALAPLSSDHNAAVVELTDVARSVVKYADRLDLDPQQLAALEQRVSLLETLKRKYGGSIVEAIAFGENAAQRMANIEGRDAELERLSTEIRAARSALDEAGRALRAARTKAAPLLSRTVSANLLDLGFKQSEFEARLTALDEPRLTGADSLELLFSPNPGEPLKPLRAVASSGEISRVMLAIKSALADKDAIPLLVFDEIDANVGGEIANAVGARMRALSENHQVLCITHLPQVAAAASRQFVVSKRVTKGRTYSELREVTGDARRAEIARMLGGQSNSALGHAETLLTQT